MSLPRSIAVEDDPLVTITGGAEDVGHHYGWVVTNEYSSPIVHIEFPHYKAYLFFAPEGWSTKSTHIVHIGVKDKPGVCTATADSPAHGISRGRSATFRMHVGDLRAKPRPASVRVRFADGVETIIDGVELPVRDSKWDKYVPLIGLGSIFAAWVLISSIRRRRSSAKRAP